jgi:hypothetical protein
VNLRGAKIRNAKVRHVFGPILNVTQEQKDSAEGGVWEELPTQGLVDGGDPLRYAPRL